MSKPNAEYKRISRKKKEKAGLVEYRYYYGIRPALKKKIDKYIDKLME